MFVITVKLDHKDHSCNEFAVITKKFNYAFFGPKWSFYYIKINGYTVYVHVEFVWMYTECATWKKYNFTNLVINELDLIKKCHLLFKKYSFFDELLGKDHAVLHVHVVVGGPVDQEEFSKCWRRRVEVFGTVKNVAILYGL